MSTQFSDETYQIFAVSPSRPGDVILRDSRSRYRLYLGSARTVSRGHLSPELVTSLLERDHWRTIQDPRWRSARELESLVSVRADDWDDIFDYDGSIDAFTSNA